MIAVRAALHEDKPWILDQLQAFSQFFDSARPLFPTMEYADSLLSVLIETQLFLVSRDENGLTGFIAGFIAHHPLNPDITVLNELFWWVKPECRGSRAGLLLLRAYEDYGKQHAHWIVMTLEADSPVHPDTLIRRGFRPKETTFLKEVG